MEEFKIESTDKIHVERAKREANIILASLDKNSNEFLYKRSIFRDVISICEKIDNIEWNLDADFDFVINSVNKIINIGILSPLTLKDDEFEETPFSPITYNIRYPYILKDKYSIYNTKAFNIYIRSAYNHDDKKEIKWTPYTSNGNHKVYISKGGVITGNYIQNCFIRKNIIDKGCFTIQSVLNIPVSLIVYKEDNKNKFIYIVDHREPKLKALKEFYEVPEYFDDVIKVKKFNIRNYIKNK